MDQLPRSIGRAFLENLGLEPLGVMRLTVGARGVERPIEFRPGAVAVDGDLDAFLAQFPLGEPRPEEADDQTVADRLVGGVMPGGRDERDLLTVRPDLPA